MDAHLRAVRIVNTDFSSPQTKPCDWFNEKEVPEVPRGVRPPSYKASAADPEIKKIPTAPPPPSYLDTEVKEKPERQKLERSRSGFCGSFLICTCLEPFSRCYNEPHYHSKGQPLIPICCGKCDGRKMTCWCSEHDWPHARMAFVGELLHQQEDESRDFRGSITACRRGYKRCVQPCSHSFAEWHQSIGGEWFWSYDGNWAGPHLRSDDPVDSDAKMKEAT